MSKAVILCVDDETTVLETLKKQMKNHFGNEYLYEMAESAEEAWEVIEELSEDGIEICLIVSDWLMPGTKGDKFLISVHEKFPNIIKVLLTGQADPDVIKQVQKQVSLHRCLNKPWSSEDLIETIKSGLGKLCNTQ